MRPSSVFVDSSALFALLSQEDAFHEDAQVTFRRLLDADDDFVTHNYAVLETSVLAQRRLGLAAVACLRGELLPAMETAWVDQRAHETAVITTLAAGRRDISLVDWISFELMRRRGIERAFAFDRHFTEQGFQLV